jgi:hypothetical protein
MRMSFAVRKCGDRRRDERRAAQPGDGVREVGMRIARERAIPVRFVIAVFSFHAIISSPGSAGPP